MVILIRVDDWKSLDEDRLLDGDKGTGWSTPLQNESLYAIPGSGLYTTTGVIDWNLEKNTCCDWPSEAYCAEVMT
jgi:hypothetical protein